jgi:hypothetical protein
MWINIQILQCIAKVIATGHRAFSISWYLHLFSNLETLQILSFCVIMRPYYIGMIDKPLAIADQLDLQPFSHAWRSDGTEISNPLTTGLALLTIIFQLEAVQEPQTSVISVAHRKIFITLEIPRALDVMLQQAGQDWRYTSYFKSQCHSH